MSSMVDQGAVLFWSRTVKSTPNPFCAIGQFCSMTLPSMRARLAILSSSRFLTDQAVPLYRGSPAFHARGLMKLLYRISMSEGIRPLTAGSAPPNMTFSPAASR